MEYSETEWSSWNWVNIPPDRKVGSQSVLQHRHNLVLLFYQSLSISIRKLHVSRTKLGAHVVCSCGLSDKSPSQSIQPRMLLSMDKIYYKRSMPHRGMKWWESLPALPIPGIGPLLLSLPKEILVSYRTCCTIGWMIGYEMKSPRTEDFL